MVDLISISIDVNLVLATIAIIIIYSVIVTILQYVRTLIRRFKWKKIVKDHKTGFRLISIASKHDLKFNSEKLEQELIKSGYNLSSKRYENILAFSLKYSFQIAIHLLIRLIPRNKTSNTNSEDTNKSNT